MLARSPPSPVVQGRRRNCVRRPPWHGTAPSPIRSSAGVLTCSLEEKSRQDRRHGGPGRGEAGRGQQPPQAAHRRPAAPRHWLRCEQDGVHAHPPGCRRQALPALGAGADLPPPPRCLPLLQTRRHAKCLAAWTRCRSVTRFGRRSRWCSSTTTRWRCVLHIAFAGVPAITSPCRLRLTQELPEGPIDAATPVDQVRQEPYPLPPRCVPHAAWPVVCPARATP